MARSRPYGAEHRRRRKIALREAFGTPCPRCGLPMLPGQNLDFGHSEDLAYNRASRADRMEHADSRDCPAGGNRTAGARLGQKIRDLKPSRKW